MRRFGGCVLAVLFASACGETPAPKQSGEASNTQTPPTQAASSAASTAEAPAPISDSHPPPGPSMTGSKADMVRIAAGELAGAPVAAFYLDRTEITVEAYTKCVTAGKCGAPKRTASNNYGRPDRQTHPANGLNHAMAAAYCRWAGKRLPTQREWQWAAQGREEARVYPWGDAAPTCEYTVFEEMKKTGPRSFSTTGSGCGQKRTEPVGSRPKGASRDGLLDMAGNVYEWTSSSRGDRKLMCGGSWSTGSNLGTTKTASTYAAKATRRHIGYGARCAGTP